MHARKQLAFGMLLMIFFSVTDIAEDMWWLGLALFLVCIIEVCFPYIIYQEDLPDTLILII